MEDDNLIVVLLILLSISIIGHLIHASNSDAYEAISVNALDETCKTIMNSSTAKFHQQAGLQKEFSCRDDDKFFVVGENKYLYDKIK